MILKQLTEEGFTYYHQKKNSNYTKVIIKNYMNIWADHNKNDLEYLEIFQNSKEDLPYKINIKFKGSIFTVKKL